MSQADPAVTYGSYLKIDDLLSLQQFRSEGPEHDELLFIVIHQVYELWFKELLHEFDRVMALLGAKRAPEGSPEAAATLRPAQGRAQRGGESRGAPPSGVNEAQHTLKRILTILKVLVAQIDILETMTPLEFQSFRNRLEAASGFQSDQFRQIEFVLGAKASTAVERFATGTRARQALDDRWQQPTVWDAFLHYLKREGYAVPRSQLTRDVTAPIEPSQEIQAILIEIYRRDPKNSELCERLVDLDEGIQEWRYRHVKMVERTIGITRGTGGSSGAPYLRGTVGRPAFPDLWEIRSSL
jgi:tryptophan 2,3-dioxygenase